MQMDTKYVLLATLMVLFSMPVFAFPKMSIDYTNCDINGYADTNSQELTISATTASLISKQIDVQTKQNNYLIENKMKITDNNVLHDGSVSLTCDITYPSCAATTDGNWLINTANYNTTYTITKRFFIKGPTITNIPVAVCSGNECTTTMRVVSCADITGNTRLVIDSKMRRDNATSFPNFNTDSLKVEVNGDEKDFTTSNGTVIVTDFDLDSGNNDITLTWTVGAVVPTAVPPTPFPWLYIIIAIIVVIVILAVAALYYVSE